MSSRHRGGPGRVRTGGTSWAGPGQAGKARTSRGGPEGPTPGSAADQTPEADPESVARAICLRQLTMAPRSRGQLAEALRRRDVPADVAERVLDRLSEVGLVDDAEFARGWVRSRHVGRGLAGRALGSELRQRGVEAEVVRDAVGELGPEQELATARALVARKLPGMHRLDHATQVRRLAGMLGRKGYSGGVALQAVREAMADEASADLDAPDQP